MRNRYLIILTINILKLEISGCDSYGPGSTGLPHSPLVEDPPTSLEASLPAPPQRPRNMARKRVTKKLKVTETTSQEVISSSRVVEYLT
jgi:hypothetical protein